MRTIVAFFIAASLVACGNSYHPEYHPVTATTVNQNYSSPVYVGGGAPRPVVVTPQPSQQSPIVIDAITPDPPPGFFDH